MEKRRVYLDHNATTPLRPEVAEIIRQFSGHSSHNPSSVHSSGQKVRRKLDDSREEVARLLGCQPSEIIFTSGGTESAHLAWKAFSKPNQKIATTPFEHSCVLSAAEQGKKNGAKVEFITHEELLKGEERFDFVSIQHANNETGILFPVRQIVEKMRGKKTTIHTDAVQTLGKIPYDVHELGVELLSLSGHKLGGLQGIGALYVRKGSPFESLWEGGPQEKGRRPGTENVLGILSLGEACKSVRTHKDEELSRVQVLRDGFEKEITKRISGLEIIGREKPRIPNTSNILFDEVDGESLMISMDLAGIDVSTGAACSSGSLKPSHVLLAMGYDPKQAKSSIRFSFGWNTTPEDLEFALDVLPKLVAQVRNAGQKYNRK